MLFEGSAVPYCPFSPGLVNSFSYICTGQAKLQASSVLIVGAGGLGCPAAAYLAAAGVGKFYSLVVQCKQTTVYPADLSLLPNGDVFLIIFRYDGRNRLR